jgi:hypothetical protein
MSQENVEIVRRTYEVINSIGRTGHEFVDPEGFAPDLWERLTPDFELHDRPDLPDSKAYRGRDESKEFWRKTQELLPNSIGSRSRSLIWAMRSWSRRGSLLSGEAGAN